MNAIMPHPSCSSSSICIFLFTSLRYRNEPEFCIQARANHELTRSNKELVY